MNMHHGMDVAARRTAQFDAIRARVERRARWRRRIDWFCLAMSLFTFLYFAGQFVRALAS